MITGVPVQRMAEAESARLKNMANDLKAVVVAQDKAIEKMVKAIQRNRVGLKEEKSSDRSVYDFWDQRVSVRHIWRRNWLSICLAVLMR